MVEATKSPLSKDTKQARARQCPAMCRRSLDVCFSSSERVVRTQSSSKESEERDLHDYGTNSV